MNDQIPELPDVEVAGQAERPCREWLLRCYDADGDLSACAIEVSSGTIDIVTPGSSHVFSLDRSDIVGFQQALRAAIVRANADYAEGGYLPCG